MGVCVEDGWFKQPHFAESEGTLGLGETAHLGEGAHLDESAHTRMCLSKTKTVFIKRAQGYRTHISK